MQDIYSDNLLLIDEDTFGEVDAEEETGGTNDMASFDIDEEEDDEDGEELDDENEE